MARVTFIVLGRRSIIRPISGETVVSCRIKRADKPHMAPENCAVARLTFFSRDGIEYAKKKRATIKRKARGYYSPRNPAKARQNNSLAGPPTGTNFGA